jgi:CRP/FNR family transcriptional regulator, anaerobic regulatory protein
MHQNTFIPAPSRPSPISLREDCGALLVRQLARSLALQPEQIDGMHSLHGRHRALGSGEHLFHLGERLSALYVSRHGSLKSVAMTEEGVEQVIAFHLPGELIGLDALGSGQHRCQAVALEAAEVCELNVGQLERAAREVPGLQHGLLRLMGRSVEVDQDHLALLGRPQAIERLALFLVGLVTRLQAQGLDGERFALPMSRADIASYLGLVIETVSRGFGRLQDEGLLKVSGRRLQILDMHGLRVHAHCVRVEPEPRGLRRA